MSFLKKAVVNKPLTGANKPSPKPGVSTPTKPTPAKPAKPNPLGAVKKPAMPKAEPKNEEAKEETKPAVKPASKPNPLGPIKKPAKPVMPKKEKEPEVEIEEGKEIDLGMNEVPEVKEETPKVEAVKETVKEKVEETKEEVVEEKVEEVKEEKPKKKTTKKDTKAKKEEKVETKKVSNLPKADINTIEDYMSPVVLPTLEAWEEEKEEVKEVMATLEIDADMNPATAKVLLADMATAYGELNRKLTHYKTQYENLTGKDGIIECIKSIHGQGKNAEERKFAATDACMNYVKPGEKTAVNLFEYEYVIREKYYFYNGIVNELEFKRQLLITFNGMLNAEARV